MSNSDDLMNVLDSFLDDIRNTKQAESAAEQGHVEDQGDSGTSHPSKSVDNQSQTAPEGSRSSENTSDVKKTVTGVPTDSHDESGEEGGSENPITEAKFTGETPSEETSSTKDRPDSSHDSGHGSGKTTHPANVNFGEKYGSFREFANDFSKIANDLLAQVAMLTDNTETETEVKQEPESKEASAEENPTKAEAKPEAEAETKGEDTVEKKADAPEEDADVKAGEEAAKLAAEELGAAASDDQLKLASDMLEIVKEAQEYADLLAEVYKGIESNTKQAFDPAALDAAGGEAPAEEVPAEEPGAEVGGEVGGDAEIMELLQALQAAGITEEDLANIDPQALLSLLGGAGGGEEEAPPMEGALPVEGAPLDAGVA